eukprot:3813562-Lingulodinium_polyedra.AAC.1
MADNDVANPREEISAAVGTAMATTPPELVRCAEGRLGFGCQFPHRKLGQNCHGQGATPDNWAS